MDLSQRKLTKDEWESIEIPVSSAEMAILKLIIEGYHNVNTNINNTDSLITFFKIEYSTQIESYLFQKYFAEKFRTLIDTYSLDYLNSLHCMQNEGTIVRLKSSDQIRLNHARNKDMFASAEGGIYEFVLYKHIEQLCLKKYNRNMGWMFHYYTLSKLLENNVMYVNNHIVQIIQKILQNLEHEVSLLYIIEHALDYIEKNNELLKYRDLQLYKHQKDIFTILKNERTIPKLILYIAPTGTGKTLTPLGISEEFRVIFVCAARHVGLALARSAISMNKKIAFAFGCESAADIRLHYFAAKDYTKDRRSGQIRKVDNSVGDKVEIMICDIRSYIYAMYYMMAFNDATNIITYWDEPTITMDYPEHELHAIIQRNWRENIIPNMVLSSATLPKIHELVNVSSSFQEKFSGAESPPEAAYIHIRQRRNDSQSDETSHCKGICSEAIKLPTAREFANINDIVSYDCIKSIPIIDNCGYVVMPHYLSDNYENILQIVEHCQDYLTLLRYFDLEEATRFILETYNLNDSHEIIKSAAQFERNFASISDISMSNIKIYYLKLLKNIHPEKWPQLYQIMMEKRRPRIATSNTIQGCQGCRGNGEGGPQGLAGVYITTKDAYTLTDGPTLFLSNDIRKIARFCIEQSNIPASVMTSIMDKILFNNKINERISNLEKTLEIEEQKLVNKSGNNSSGSDTKNNTMKQKSEKIMNKSSEKSQEKNRNLGRLKEQIATYQGMIQSVSLNEIFIPNKPDHLDKWIPLDLKSCGPVEIEDIKAQAFSSNLDEGIITSIMLLDDVEDSWKVLLLLGIGVLTQHRSIAYTEIMKKCADIQRLYLIIADSDYVYGTNYQFCHCYLSKDLSQITQEKMIQAMGRVGRNNIQQNYTIRFRDNQHIATLFTKIASENKPEVVQMNRLLG